MPLPFDSHRPDDFALAVPEPSAAAADAALVEACRLKSLELLRANTRAGGVLAATQNAQSEARSYTRVFGRDAAICVLAMCGSGDAALEAGAVASLDALAAGQAPNGQIPKYVDPASGEADFWYLGCIDATLWWLIAVDHVRRHAKVPGISVRWQPAIGRAIGWLKAQEHQYFFLLQQNEASDWADIMPRSGFVLYTNALWYRVKLLYDLAQLEETRYHFNALFNPFDRELPEYRRERLLGHYARRGQRNPGLYLSFVNLSFAGDEGDVFGNVLAVLFGLAGDSMAQQVMKTLRAGGAAEPYPGRAVVRPIEPQDDLWRFYMARHQQNYPHQYHNGGIWPFIGGFWTMALAITGQREQAQAGLGALAQANAAADWRFSEWFHGETLQPSGMAGQSWNAAAFLIAQQAVEQGRFSM